VDSALLVSVNDAEENNFIESWLQANAKQGLSWFTSGTRDPGATGPIATVKFTWTDGDQTEVVGAQFWFSDTVRSLPGNRIVYYTDGSTWGWSVVDDSNVTLPYICEIRKEFLYKIVTVNRGYDYGLKEIDPMNLPMGPVFTTQPVSTIYDVASTLTLVTFTCEVAANPFPSYVWYVTHDQVQKPVNLTDQSKTVTNGRLSLQSPSQTKDNGDYECLAKNSFGAILSDFATLSFGYLNDFPKSKRDAVKANAYTGIGIQCIPPATGYDMLSYTWYKETFLNLIRSSVKWYIFVSSDGTLYFQSVTRDDQGDYFCMVTRPNAMDNFQEGKVSMPIPLQVTDAVGSQQDPQIVNSFPKAFPTSPMVGDNLRMECVAWGTEQLIYKWNRLDAPMPTGALFSDYSRVLTINNVQLQHGGKYRCTVTRRLGQETYKDISVSIEAAPYFTIPIENQFVDIGKVAMFRCYANGVPSVTYDWFVNATRLNISRLAPAVRSRYTISNNVLTITNVQSTDAGMFQCSASNTHGTKLCSAELRAYAFAPTFQKYPLQPNLYGIIGGNVTLTCQPEAAPEATKEWSKDGSPLSASSNPLDRVVMLPNGNIHITGLQQDDAGNYTCTATNDFGSDSTTGMLTVLPATTVIYPPKDTVVIVNQTTFLACQSSYNPAIDITYDWWHNSYKIMFVKVKNLGNTVYVWREPNYERGTGINRGGLYIRNTQFYHAGQYRCIVKSTTDEMVQSATLTVTGPPGQPAGVYGYNAMATSIQLTWWPSKPNGQPVLYYIVEIFNLAEGYWKRSSNASNVPAATDTTMTMSAVVSNLNPYTQYQFRILGVNSIGEGTPSQPSPIYRTTEAPPITYPQNLGGGGGKVGTLNITWQPMPLSEYNAQGSSVGYIVYWKKADMNEDQWDNAVINDPTQLKYVVTIGSSNFYLPYNVRIQAFNPMGKGPMSPVETIMSAEDIPKGVPINVRAVYYNCTAITVEWEPVEDSRDVMKGVLLGYRINYWIDGEQNETMALFKIIHNQTDHGLIIALRENTWYMINVQAINTAGNGPKSEDYRTRTLRAAPMEAPQDVRVSFVDYQSVLLQWRGVYTTILEEPLEGYTVRHWLRGENIYVATNVDAGKAIRFVLSGLKQQVMYEVRVFGYSRGGDGLQSSPTLEFVLGSNCDIVEDSPDKQYIYQCQGCRMKVSVVLLLIALFTYWLQLP
jgi:receptor-type tyrosine-protein phosphatase gamma